MVNNQYPATNLEAFMKIAANWQNGNHNLLEAVDLKGDMQQYLNNTSMNMYKKRERTQNWNHQEKKFLLDLCRKDMRIIENKRLDAGLTAVKNKAWKIIHQKFSRQFGTDRTCNRLKEQWRRMKACTRNEILDYNNRLAKLGSEVADRKRPSPFTFEVWEFMQEAKKACKSEALDGIDYSKIPLALEEDFEYCEDDHNLNEDQYIEDSRTPPQDLCDVDMKEETADISLKEPFNGTFHEQFGELSSHKNDFNNYQHASENLAMFTHSPSSSHRQCQSADDLKRVNIQSPVQSFADIQLEQNSLSFLSGESNCDLSAFQSAFSMSNISATLEALNAIRNGQFQNAAAAAVAIQNKIAHQKLQEELDSPPSKRQRTLSISVNSEQNENDEAAATAIITDSLHEGKSARQKNEITQNKISSISNNIENTTTTIGKNKINNKKSDEFCNTDSDIAIKEREGSYNHAEIRALMEMQNKEHLLRMKILEVQLQAAKHNRDLIEINKTFALQKLQEYTISKRLTH